MYCKKVKQFTEACEGNLPSQPTLLTRKKIDFICEMVGDELDELKGAKEEWEQADALVDAIYYLCDTAIRHGMDLDPLFEIVHRANMQKVVDGKVLRRDDGKILKPEGWQDPKPYLIQEIMRQKTKGNL